jgi:signal transduction histidine kinase
MMQVNTTIPDDMAFHEAPVPSVKNWNDLHDSDHLVQFYEGDDFLLEALSGYVEDAYSSGDVCIVVATQAHLSDLGKILQQKGQDFSSTLISLDASETMSRFMVEEQPNPELFKSLIGTIIDQAGQGKNRVRIYGEMVALLWSDSKFDAALRLEQLWNELAKTHRFTLCCAYPIREFNSNTDVSLSEVCGHHSVVIPGESYSLAATDQERLAVITGLQEKAKRLEREIAERTQTERQLRASESRYKRLKSQLEIQVEDLRRLNALSLSLTGTRDIDTLLAQVLRAAMNVQDAGMGLLFLHDSHLNKLIVRASSGFDDDTLQLIQSLPAGAGACGACFATKKRVIVEDSRIDPLFEGLNDLVKRAGFRADHSTPLITRSGSIIGVLSVQFPDPERPSNRETQLMDLYARMAADFIENARLHNELQQQLDRRNELLEREHQARLEAQRTNQMKDEFLANVSHELRTPLTSLFGWARLLRSANLDPTGMSRALECIERSVQTQRQLVEDLLDVSRIVAGKVRLDLTSVVLESVMDTALEIFRPAAESKHIRIDVYFEPGIPQIQGDPIRLQQTFNNLLSNAIKFTPEKGKVLVRLTREEDKVKISVEDTGEGIAPEFLPYVFDRFRQADSTTTRKHGGLGLGLTIARHLMVLHGAEIHAESAGKGQGSQFTISLPIDHTIDGTAQQRSSASFVSTSSS